MESELSTRILACIEVESTAAEIYHLFGKMFPEARQFWYDLAMEEENHASILAIGWGLSRVGRLPEHAVPESLPLIRKSLELAQEIKKKAEAGEVTLKEALEMSVELESAITEKYFSEVMTKETDSSAIEKLQRLVTDTESHIKKIRDFMVEKGL
jgi:hypothetical protein